MNGRTVPSRLPRPSAPVAVAVSAVATMAVVALAYAGPVNTSVPGALTFGVGATPDRSTAAVVPAALASAPPETGTSTGAGQVSAPATGPLTGATFGPATDVPSTTGSSPHGDAAAATGTSPAGTDTLPTGGAATPDVHTAGVAPAATLVPPAPPLTTARPPETTVPAVTDTGSARAAGSDSNGNGGNGNGGDNKNAGGRQSSLSGHDSAAAPGGITPSVVAPDYPVVSAQALDHQPPAHLASPPKRSGPGHSKGR